MLTWIAGIGTFFCSRARLLAILNNCNVEDPAEYAAKMSISHVRPAVNQQVEAVSTRRARQLRMTIHRPRCRQAVRLILDPDSRFGWCLMILVL
jgi:hypothetical protein